MRHILPTLSLLLVSTAGTLEAQAAAYAITTNARGVQQLVRFDPTTPGSVSTLGPTGARLTGIDFRPATNALYGYDGNQLYIVNQITGVAALAFDVGNTTGNAGFDFNPVVDRIRVVDAGGTNLRLNQITGGTTTDMPYTFASGDVNFGRRPSFTAVAYTNSDTDAATGTTLYGIDSNLGQLITISNPNGGSISTVGSLGIGAFSTITGFDIFTRGGVNTAFFAATSVGATASQLYTIDLTTGSATLVGGIGADNMVEGLAITAVPEPGTWAMLAIGLAAVAVAKRRKRGIAHLERA
ncbi:MAG: DUF4394 domain-containing protein [Phycisphaerae bacterium]|nr:DUF4394 domain-containing protein [Gemmatimonadaceae bacterium]